MSLVRGAARRGLATAAGLVGLACGAPAPPPIPPGAHLVADGAVLRDALGRLAGLEGTPLGRHARLLSERLAGCDTVAGHASSGELEALLEGLDCASAHGIDAALARERAAADLLLVAPAGGERRVVVRGRGQGDGGLALDVRIDPPGATGPAALLVPDPEADAGAPVLSGAGLLIHARVRPRDGIDLASLVPEGSQGDRLFRMKSALFGRTVLGDAWELAVYMPEPGAALPPMALALDVKRREVAEAAMREFLADLARAWPIHPTATRLAGREGACLLDLRILPDFAPCWVATERALVVGWSPDAVKAALAPAGGAPRAAGPSRLSVRLDRLPEADRRLRASRAPGDAPPPTWPPTWGWERIEVSAGDAAGRVRVELAAEADAG